jgi:twinkle protein
MTHTLEHPTKLVELKTRGLNEHTCRTYGVSVTLDTNEVAFPYYKDGVLVAHKLRNKNKEFRIDGNGKSLPFFGMQTIPHQQTSRDTLIITEGEFDALSAYQMTGKPSVSVPSGAGSALKTVKENLKWVESFRRVYVCFDNDEAGNAAADDVMNLLKVGVGFRIILPYKDANELLLTEESEAKTTFNDCIKKAQRKVTNVLLSKEEKANLFDSAFSSQSESCGYPTGIYAIDRCTEHPFTLDNGEVTVLFAAASVGKSSVARQIAANYVSRKQRVLYFALEETLRVYMQRIMSMVARYDFRYSPDPIKPNDLDKYRAYAQEYLEVARLDQYTWDEIEEAIEYAVRVNGVELVVFDNLSAYTATVNKNLTEAIAETMTGFVRLGKQFGHHTLVVSHTRRDNDLKEGQVPTMTHGLGGGGIERFADNVLGFARVQGEDTTNFKILKHRTNGEVGEGALFWNKDEAAFIGVDVNDDLRFKPRKIHSRSNAKVAETSPESVTEHIPSDTGAELQPRLQTGGTTQDDLCGSEGETGLRDAKETGSLETTREGLPEVSSHKGFPTIQQTRSAKHLGLGK